MSVMPYSGVSFDNLRKALYLMFFGVDIVEKDGKKIALSQSFDSPKYRYIIPMQGNFDNPLEDIPDAEGQLAKNTFIEYWIDRDEELTQDDYTVEDGVPVNRQKCVALILLRFIGKDAEIWAKSFRHLIKRKGISEIWSGVCNSEKLPYTLPIVPRRINFFGKNSQIAFDVRFKLHYDESISTGWQPLEGVNMTVKGKITVED